ncbi:retrovirus-related pol polyprotein from transposon TNT 1-94 [Tanacetum coccineum]
MLIFSCAPLFLWGEAIDTACYTQNHIIIHHRFEKTPYELINGRKPDISFLHVFGALCYPKNDRKDSGKLGAKGDIGFFIGYSANSCAYRVYNRRTKKIKETMNVTFDELSVMAYVHITSMSSASSEIQRGSREYEDIQTEDRFQLTIHNGGEDGDEITGILIRDDYCWLRLPNRLHLRQRLERLLSMPTHPPSPPISLSPTLLGIQPKSRQLRIASLREISYTTQKRALCGCITAALPSPPLPPSLIHTTTYDPRDDIPDPSEPPSQESCLLCSRPLSRPEIAPRPPVGKEVNTRVTELLSSISMKYRLIALLKDAQIENSTSLWRRSLCFPRVLGSLDRIESSSPSEAFIPTMTIVYDTRPRSTRHIKLSYSLQGTSDSDNNNQVHELALNGSRRDGRASKRLTVNIRDNGREFSAWDEEHERRG